jgi:hypothetical protein
MHGENSAYTQGRAGEAAGAVQHTKKKQRINVSCKTPTRMIMSRISTESVADNNLSQPRKETSGGR